MPTSRPEKFTVIQNGLAQSLIFFTTENEPIFCYRPAGHKPERGAHFRKNTIQSQFLVCNSKVNSGLSQVDQGAVASNSTLAFARPLQERSHFSFRCYHARARGSAGKNVEPDCPGDFSGAGRPELPFSKCFGCILSATQGDSLDMDYRVCTSAALILLAATTAAYSQSDAELGGAMRDATGGAIPGVSVTVTKLDTRAARSTVSNDSGFFVMPLLPPGEYQIRLTKEGFKPLTQTGIVLQVNEQARMTFTLEVGGVVEEVTITARAPLLETATAARGQVIDNQKIVELPLNGRDYLQLALLSAGARPV